MRIRVLRLWEIVATSYWFLPGLMIVGAFALSYVTLALDRHLHPHSHDGYRWIYPGGAKGAQDMVAALAGAIITVTGVVFSVTIVVLSLASSQFGPWVLRNFMVDRANQVVLGIFIGTFTYCLLILPRITTDEMGQSFIPRISVSVSFLLSLISIGALTFFIHHVSTSIQAFCIVERITQDLEDAIDSVMPAQTVAADSDNTRPRADGDVPEGFEAEAHTIRSEDSGYIDVIDYDTILTEAENRDLIVRVVNRPGKFLVAGSPILRLWPPDRVDDRLIRTLRDVVKVAHRRTPTQDIEFGLNQLVEIALRALSPGINDTLTALLCVDRIGQALCRIVTRVLPPTYYYDKAGRLRIVTQPETFQGLADAVFDLIRQSLGNSISTAIRLLEMIARVMDFAHRQEDVETLLGHAAMIRDVILKQIEVEKDRHDLEERFAACLQAAERKGLALVFPSASGITEGEQGKQS